MRVAIFGDSITQGFHDDEMGGWVSRLTAYGNRKILTSDYEFDVSFFNLGILGDCTNRLLTRFESEAATRLKEKDGAIIFSIGVNDTQRYVATEELKTSAVKFNENVQTLLARASELASKTIIIGIAPIIESVVQPMPWAPDRGHYARDVQAFDQILEENAAVNDSVYVSLRDIWGGSPEKFLIDGIHPNAEGHRLIFEQVKAALEKEGIL